MRSAGSPRPPPDRFSVLQDTVESVVLEDLPVDALLRFSETQNKWNAKRAYGKVLLARSLEVDLVVGEMLAISGPDMIEYALTCVSNEVLCGEGERCVLALHGLCTSVQELPALHTKFIRCLFLNLHIWWRSSFHMQSIRALRLAPCATARPRRRVLSSPRRAPPRRARRGAPRAR